MAAVAPPAVVEGSATNEVASSVQGPSSDWQRIIVMVEGTAVMASSWLHCHRKWVERMLRTLQQRAAQQQQKQQQQQQQASATGAAAAAAGQQQLATQYCLIVFGTYDPTTPAPVQSSDWTSSLSELLAMLDGIQFVGGVGSRGTALAAALGEAIVVSKCPYPGGARPPPPVPQPLPPSSVVEGELHLATHVLLFCSPLSPCRLPIRWACERDTKASLAASSYYANVVDTLERQHAKGFDSILLSRSNVDYLAASLQPPVTPGTADVWDLCLGLTRHHLSLSVMCPYLSRGSKDASSSVSTCIDLYRVANMALASHKGAFGRAGALKKYQQLLGLVSPLWQQATALYSQWQAAAEAKAKASADKQQQVQQRAAPADASAAAAAQAPPQAQQQQHHHHQQAQQQQQQQQQQRPVAPAPVPALAAVAQLQPPPQQQAAAQQAPQQQHMPPQQQHQQAAMGQQQTWLQAAQAAARGPSGDLQQQELGLAAGGTQGLGAGMMPQHGMQQQQPQQQQVPQQQPQQQQFGMMGQMGQLLMGQQQQQQQPQQQPQQPQQQQVAVAGRMMLQQQGGYGAPVQQQQLLGGYLQQQPQQQQPPQQLLPGLQPPQVQMPGQAGKQEQKQRLPFWRGSLILNIADQQMLNAPCAEIELLASAAGHASLAAAWAGRGQLVASSALPIATVTQYMKQAQATSKLTRVYFRVLTQYAPGFSWVQRCVQGSADRQVILAAQGPGTQAALFVFGWQSMSMAANRSQLAQATPINLLEGIVVLTG